MLFTINKKNAGTWVLTPNSGVFKGQPIGTMECAELTSIVSVACKVVGVLKAVWGLNLNHGVDAHLDIDMVRALCLGRPFKNEGGLPVQWFYNRLYDPSTGRAISTCRRLLINGTELTRST